MICAYRFDAAGVAQSLGDGGLPPVPGEGAGCIWLHTNLSHAAALETLRRAGALDEDLLAAMQQGSRATRIERLGETLFAVVDDVTFDFSFDPDDIATLWVHVHPGRVLTARRQPLRSIDRLRMAVKRGERLSSPRGAPRPPAAGPGRRTAGHRAPDGRSHRRHRGPAAQGPPRCRDRAPAPRAGAPAAPARARARGRWLAC